MVSWGWNDNLRPLSLIPSSSFSFHHLTIGKNHWHLCTCPTQSSSYSFRNTSWTKHLVRFTNLCTKQAGIVSMTGNGKLQKDSVPTWLVLLRDPYWCETWVKGEALNQGDQVGGLGQNLGLKWFRLRQTVAWDYRGRNGPQKIDSPAPSPYQHQRGGTSQHLPGVRWAVGEVQLKGLLGWWGETVMYVYPLELIIGCG